MTEEEARNWIADRHGAEAVDRLSRYVEALLAANASQNLISRSSEALVWARHILDSAQLLRFAPDAGSWLDVGSGPGLPGVVIALLQDQPVTLVEPRRKRAEFLAEITAQLSLSHVTLAATGVERVQSPPFGAITARAYAALTHIFATARHLADAETIWVLPKGRSAEGELDEARRSWTGMFHVEQSLSDSAARIIVASGVKARR